MPTETTVSGKTVEVNRIHKGEKTIQVIFINNEFPRADLEFTFDRRRWHLLDGKTHKLPLHVVEHLNGLVVPEAQYETDPKTGQMTMVRQYLRHRFTCQPTNIRGLVAKEAKEEE